MSQVGTFFSSINPAGAVLELTGNNNTVHVAPTVGNINIVGTGLITVTGDAATHTLTISSAGATADQFDGDTGSAIPVAGILNIVGSANIHTAASGNSVEVILDDDVSIAGSFTAGTTLGFITSQTGDITATAGNFNLPNTNTGATAGIINFNSVRWISNYGTNNTFVGGQSGNTTLTTGLATDNTGIGHRVLLNVSQSGLNTAVGSGALQNVDNTINPGLANENCAVGYFSCNALTEGSVNSAFGAETLINCTTGSNNTAIGQGALDQCTTGNFNTAVGVGAGGGITTGSTNCCVGVGTGSAYTGAESNNLLLGTSQHGVNGESNTIRIGIPSQTRCFITGIEGNTVSNAQLVTIDPLTNQLGVTSTSGVTWQTVTGATPLVEGNGYFVNGASTLQFTLPISAAVGDTFEIAVLDTAVGGWQINQNALQYIIMNAADLSPVTSTKTTTGVTGNVVTNAVSGIFLPARLICSIANTAFVIQYGVKTALTFT